MQAAEFTPGCRVALFFAALFVAGAINTAFLPLWFSDHGIGPGAIEIWHLWLNAGSETESNS